MTESALYLLDHLEEVPVLVIPCTQKSGGAAGWQPSIYPAVWSFMLALRSRGLGSCLTTAHLFREREAAELLGIPDDYAQACLLPVAYYTGTEFRPRCAGRWRSSPTGTAGTAAGKRRRDASRRTGQSKITGSAEGVRIM